MYGDEGGDIGGEGDVDWGEGEDRGEGVFKADFVMVGLEALRVFQNLAIRDL